MHYKDYPKTPRPKVQPIGYGSKGTSIYESFSTEEEKLVRVKLSNELARRSFKEFYAERKRHWSEVEREMERVNPPKTYLENKWEVNSITQEKERLTRELQELRREVKTVKASLEKKVETSAREKSLREIQDKVSYLSQIHNPTMSERLTLDLLNLELSKRVEVRRAHTAKILENGGFYVGSREGKRATSFGELAREIEGVYVGSRGDKMGSTDNEHHEDTWRRLEAEKWSRPEGTWISLNTKDYTKNIEEPKPTEYTWIGKIVVFLIKLIKGR